jgi:class 3 adenylate cyclase
VDVGAWLRGLGLERYEEAFRDNAIDADVLHDLTEADLEQLGVLLGHRKRLLRAISELPEPFAEHEPEAERRQLTVLFCDLVGSTALSAGLDPEDLREIIRAYHRCVGAVVERYEGNVAKYMGDGVLAYFGYPQAHEDDPERAIRAGLDLVDAVARLNPRGDLALQVRVGVATGVVVVGDLIGTGEAQERTVVGETLNLASRLQALAEPGSVVVGPSVRRLAGVMFDYADLGAHDLKGFAAPVPA